MAVLQMQRVSICAMKKNRKAVLERIQSLGLMEVGDILEDEEGFAHMDTANARASFEKAAAQADRALELLNSYAPEKKSMFASLEGKALIDAKTMETAVSRKEELQRTATRIQTLDKQLAEGRAEILKLQNSIESLTPWMALDIPMNLKGTRTTAVILGTMPGDTSAEDIYRMLAEGSAGAVGGAADAERAKDMETVGGVDVNVVSANKDMTCVVVCCMKADAEIMENALRVHGFARPSQVWPKTPAEVKADLLGQIQEQEEQMESARAELAALAENRNELRILADYYRVRADKYKVLGTLPQSERTFFISGYVPAKEVGRLENALKRYDCVIDVEELKEDEDGPVLLENNKISGCAEGILESFGLPHKGEIDPTTVMAAFYIFFFGMMLSDAAYGAIIAVACGAALIKFPRMSTGMKKSLQLFFWCGLSTLVWGVLFGGYFGDVVNVVSRTFFGHEVSIPPLWFAPLDDPMKLLIYSLGFGVIHLFVGFGIKGYMYLRDKQYMDFFCDTVLWFMLLIGLLLMLIPSSIFASIAQTTIVFPPALNLLAKGMAIVGAVGILLMSGRSNKNFALRLALGAYDLYNISGWLSDLLSYSRLLALGLATGVIAQVVNQMASMFGGGVLGAILFVIIFIFGHTLNLAINMLGAYVHTNRLQYVEFFGKFYEGGGRAFEPFKENTKYTDMKEEL